MLDLAIAGERENAELPTAQIAAERPVLGQGNISCSLWLEGRQIDSPSSASRTAWILGFISAFNQYGLQSQGADVSEGKNTDELMGWIDNYCRQHQGDDLHTASEGRSLMTFARETGGDLRAGGASVQLRILPREHAVRFPLVERQNGIMRTGPFQRSSKRIPNFSTRHTVIPIARAGSRPNLRPSSNRKDDANRAKRIDLS
jgi:hypothetical protein